MSDKSKSGKLKIFISYSRQDLEFADQLVASLELLGYDVTIDRKGLSGGDDWRTKLGELLEAADTVVFLLSPASVSSPVCEWEVGRTIELGKRLLPVAITDLAGASVPKQMAALNYIFFYPSPARPDAGFGQGLKELDKALKLDVDWVRAHSFYAKRALDWESAKRADNRLLTGDDIRAAEDWMRLPLPEGMQITDLIRDYVRASKQAENERQNAETQRLAEMAAAQEARAKALEAAEQAQAEQQRATRRLARRTYAGMVVAAVLLVVAASAGLFAWWQTNEAIEQRQKAETALNQSYVNNSKYLARLASNVNDNGDFGAALALALEAMPDFSRLDATRGTTKPRAYWPSAEVPLTHAIRHLAERRIFIGHSSGVNSVAFSPDGQRIISELW